MRTQRIILTTFASLSALFGCAGLTATNEKEYLVILVLGIIGVFIANIEE
jgi:hypothetical protein